ncbi:MULTISPECIES: hypothetical protein [Rhizobium]|uniref:Uncharacterized protein n=1 Tax=Rhizobium leguminosarum bv. trifolii (strain WSM1325) TaxID=395491 RepID=C6B3T1_RHILS|nr:hypothetical protein [Rhizobium leguminosarum]ACS55002.1 hypothetical protein Rleg_0699 [Rhizobium leguminosarum bv. trifolii WSM1325]MBY2967420.1 hypothetical protein [Rhizobium leguminosarum]MBY3047297.1 hypothetical protein [Rhizobium leguminosarum]RWY64918.1 hypothetical protein EHI46_32035 [Rhizobium leguminosarum]RWY73393.1 hypothetical protein EHI48_20745 [Rhizobium leguminosarum]
MDVAPSSTKAHLCRLGNRLACFQTVFSRYSQASGDLPLEHDAEKCERFSDDIMLYFFDLDQDDFRPIGPKIILI